jgi:hypothetical protein
MDFFLWNHIKAVIYKSPVDSEQDHIASNVEAAATWHCSAQTSVSAMSSLALY